MRHRCERPGFPRVRVIACTQFVLRDTCSEQRRPLRWSDAEPVRGLS
jgi:hypothetical protein